MSGRTHAHERLGRHLRTHPRARFSARVCTLKYTQKKRNGVERYQHPRPKSARRHKYGRQAHLRRARHILAHRYRERERWTHARRGKARARVDVQINRQKGAHMYTAFYASVPTRAISSSTFTRAQALARTLRFTQSHVPSLRRLAHTYLPFHTHSRAISHLSTCHFTPIH
eukprot:4577474-Pleurochrysis_carterae.AAC.1